MRRYFVALGVGLALAGMVSAEGTAPRQRVAVLGFKNLRGDKETDWVGAATAETLITKLTGVKALLIVEREQVKKVIQEQDFQQTDITNPETAVKAGRVFGAQSVVIGSFAVGGGRVLLNARIVDVETSEVLNAAALSGGEAELMDLPIQLADAVIESLSKKVVVVEGRPEVRTGDPVAVSEAERRRIATRPTERADAYRAYGRGIDFDNKHVWAQAKQEFEKAVQLDPNFAMAWVELGRMHQNQGAWAKALPCYAKAEAFFRASGDMSNVSWTLNNMGVAHADMGDPSKALRCYKDSLGISRKLGDEPGIAQTLLNVGTVYAEQERYDDAMKYFSESLRLHRKIGDEPGVALVLNGIGGVYGQQGRMAKAGKCLEQSLVISRKLGDTPGIARTLGNVGNVHAALGRYKEAIRCYEEVIGLYRALGDPPNEAQSLYNLADAYRHLKDLGKALPLAREAAQIAHKAALPDAADYDNLVKVIERDARR